MTVTDFFFLSFPPYFSSIFIHTVFAVHSRLCVYGQNILGDILIKHNCERFTHTIMRCHTIFEFHHFRISRNSFYVEKNEINKSAPNWKPNVWKDILYIIQINYSVFGIVLPDSAICIPAIENVLLFLPLLCLRFLFLVYELPGDR